MDLDSCGNDNFYDEIASFIPQSGDYSLDEIEEILRSTESHLDTSLDLKTFETPNLNDFDLPMQDDGTTQAAQHDFQYNFNPFPSPATTATSLSACTPPYESQRTSSTSSMDEDQFNPDELMNFLNDDDVKIDKFLSDANMAEMPRRNTPSPAGSCTSSSGSSTSGIQSDASSISSMPQTNITLNLEDDLETGLRSIESYENQFSPPVVALQNTTTATTANAALLSMPVAMMPVQTTTTTSATLIPPVTQVQSINVLQGTLIPVKPVPLSTVTTLANIKTPTPIKVDANSLNPIKLEPKLAPKSLKIVTSTSTATTPAATTTNMGKITTPPNAKPKTIFLSANDFKALMQKMNTNGKSTKISGGINGQLPKIIMKTPNGKVIAANKIVQPLSGNAAATVVNAQQQPTANATQNFAPKLLKTSAGPLIIKQQQQQQQHHQHTKYTSGNVSAASSASSSPRASFSSSSGAPDLSIYKGIIDEKMFKKQQRMIKNRESASLSRKKKKEYVVSLETRINNLEKENYTLKGENTSLRSQLVAFAQTCHCKHSNVSEFILNSLNANAKGQCNGIGGEQQHVKIAPKPASKSFKQRMTAASVKKNVAVLFAMAFMVTLNVGNFQTYFNKNSIESSVENAEEPLTAGRRLLWVETEQEFNEKLNHSKHETDLEVPPLHFLRPANRTANGSSNGLVTERYRNATRSTEDHVKCCSSGSSSSSISNQTENLRLASNLHKWIDGNDYLNLSLHRKFGNGLENAVRFGKLTTDYFDIKTIDLPLQGPGPGLGDLTGKQKRKYYIHQQETIYENNNKRQRTLETHKDNANGNNFDKAKNSLELFKPKISEEYLRLFKGIKRQDDTFYVLSFNMDHILLPANAYNKSARPKMSLMLPAGDPTLNGDIVLMQIDCEVINTTELELKSDMIPEKLRPTKYTNVNLHPTPKPNDVANNETVDTNAKVRETAKAPAKSTSSNAEQTKAKPTVRTYFMMGPKSQTQADAAGASATTSFRKKPPVFVKLNENEEGIGAVTMNMKNSTLFTKMRETVGAELAP